MSAIFVLSINVYTKKCAQKSSDKDFDSLIYLSLQLVILFYFFQSDQVSYEQFSYWLKGNPDATIISKWLLLESASLSLSGEHDTPTFYQTLAGVTHCKNREIMHLVFGNFSLEE